MPHESTVSHVDSNEDMSSESLPPIGLRRRSDDMATLHSGFHNFKLQGFILVVFLKLSNVTSLALLKWSSKI